MANNLFSEEPSMQKLLVSLDVKPGAALESQSGHFFHHPRIFGCLSGPAKGRVGAIITHPTSNFMGHYLLEPMAKRGVGLLALNTRYVGNDCTLLMERAIQDIGAGVKWMRERFDTVYLIGNSGGGSLMCFYQSQAERLTVTHTPAGDPVDLEQSDLPVADGIALVAAHLGRPYLLCNWLDASLTDESDPLSRDGILDIFDKENGPPFRTGFVARVRTAQKARSERITRHVKSRLAYLRSLPVPIHDEPFLVYRTYADPRFLDLALDPNDRKPGGNKKDSAQLVNYGVNNLARFNSLTGWMSQWSFESHADGPANLAKTTIPVLHLEYTADGSIFPSDTRQWSAACQGREEFHRIKMGTHYMVGRPDLVEEVADRLTDWGSRLKPGSPGAGVQSS